MKILIWKTCVAITVIKTLQVTGRIIVISICSIIFILRFVIKDDHPYCTKCYDVIFANICTKCNTVISIDSKVLDFLI